MSDSKRDGAAVLRLDSDDELVETLEIMISRFEYQSRMLRMIVKMSPCRRRKFIKSGKVRAILGDLLQESCFVYNKSR